MDASVEAHKRVWPVLWRYAERHRRWMAALAALLIVEALIAMCPPLLTKAIIDGITNALPLSLPPRASAHERAVLAWLVGLLFLAFACQNLLGVCSAWLSASLSFAVSRDLRLDLLEKILRTPVRDVERLGSGDLIARVNQDTASLEGFLANFMQMFLINALRLLFIPVILFALSWKLALLVIVPVPAMVWLTHVFWKRVRDALRSAWEYRGELTRISSEAIGGVTEIKVLGTSGHTLSRFGQKDEAYTEARIRASRLVGLKEHATSMLTSGGLVLLWLFGGLRVLDQTSTIGEIVAFAAFASMFYGPVVALTRISEWYTHVETIGLRVSEVLEWPDEVGLGSGIVVRRPERVSVGGVWFGYEPGRHVLRGIDLTIPMGARIAIVGKSGAGKTTILGLLLGLYRPEKGQVIINGNDLGECELEEYRRQIGFVPQKVSVFSGTIAENIGVQRPDAGEVEIIRAAKLAGAHDFIQSRASGYDAYLGPSGTRLSAGEAQRIGLARALCHNPSLLLWDEPTSNLDADTETQFVRRVAEIAERRTLIVVTHRPAILEAMERIVVADEGEIIRCVRPEERREVIQHLDVDLDAADLSLATSG